MLSSGPPQLTSINKSSGRGLFAIVNTKRNVTKYETYDKAGRRRNVEYRKLRDRTHKALWIPSVLETLGAMIKISQAANLKWCFVVPDHVPAR
jgi:hypothetical protein